MINKYILDNNALKATTAEQRNSQFFLDNCVIPEDVYDEVKRIKDRDNLIKLVQPRTISLMDSMKIVMESIPHNDLSLIDLYNNKGSADPSLIAIALSQNSPQMSLFPEKWHIVTNDKAITKFSKRFSIPTLTSKQFAKILDKFLYN